MTNVADPGLISLVKDLCATQRSAALATQEGGQPYLSLMGFAATPNLTTIIVATDRSTRKYANLVAEPRVALLIDNRSNTPADTREAVAVTVLGLAMEAPPEERETLLGLFLNKHPHLEDFATSPTCALIAVRVATYIVVQRFGEVQELRMI
jgi:nitroimidazol reductase NimA-like FMN-containing flavoprotein (pyridoxamine 5'-phosphate oxidase superfamily)